MEGGGRQAWHQHRGSPRERTASPPVSQLGSGPMTPSCLT